MEYTVEFSAEFDHCGHPCVVGRIEIRTYLPKRVQQTLVLVLDDEEVVLMTVNRDQWGVWYEVMNALIDNDGKLSHYLQSTTIAQEDGTRSFIDALIKALTQLRNSNEVDTKDAKLLKAEVQEFDFGN